MNTFLLFSATLFFVSSDTIPVNTVSVSLDGVHASQEECETAMANKLRVTDSLNAKLRDSGYDPQMYTLWAACVPGSAGRINSDMPELHEITR